MRILIQQLGTGLFLDARRTWVFEPSKALAFVNAIRAHDYIVYHRIEKATVVTEASAMPTKLAQSTSAVVDQLNETALGSLTPENEHMKSKPTTPLTKISPPAASAKAPAKVQEPVKSAPVPSTASAEGKKAIKKAPAKTTATAVAPTAAKSPAPMVEEPPKTITPAPAKASAQVAKPEVKKTVVRVEAAVDVGFGNSLFIRGQGAGLSWDSGVPLTCVDGTRWVWDGTLANEQIEFKLLLNDAVWSKGENLVVAKTGTVLVQPEFE